MAQALARAATPQQLSAGHPNVAHDVTAAAEYQLCHRIDQGLSGRAAEIDTAQISPLPGLERAYVAVQPKHGGAPASGHGKRIPGAVVRPAGGLQTRRHQRKQLHLAPHVLAGTAAGAQP